jgi:chromate transporter
LHGIRGGIAAGALFVLPAALLLWALSLLYVMGRDLPVIHGFFDGIKPVVVALVVSAFWKIKGRLVQSRSQIVIAVVSLALFFLGVSYPWVVIAFALLGVFLLQGPGMESGDLPVFRRPVAPLILVPVLWAIPVLLISVWIGWSSVPVRVALLYAKAAVLSFGGAYAALSYVAFHASGDWGWLTPGQMLDGIGLAETTPGPLLMALQ